MEEKFYEYFNLNKECCLVKKSAKELLLLCLRELSKIPSNKIDYSQVELELFPDDFERRIFDCAGYWSNDLAYALEGKLISLNVETTLVHSAEERKDTIYPVIFEKIYAWLESEYNYVITMEG